MCAKAEGEEEGTQSLGYLYQPGTSGDPGETGDPEDTGLSGTRASAADVNARSREGAFSRSGGQIADHFSDYPDSDNRNPEV